MLSRVDVDALQVATWMVSARAPVWVAHLIIQGVYLPSPVLPYWILIFTVESPAVQSILKIQTLLTLVEQLFAFFLALG